MKKVVFALSVIITATLLGWSEVAAMLAQNRQATALVAVITLAGGAIVLGTISCRGKPAKGTGR